MTLIEVIPNMTGEQGFFVHESSYVDVPSSIGSGTRIWHFCHIMKDCEIGRNCNIGQNVVISPGCRVGNNVKIQNNVSVYTGVILEDNVFCGPSMVFTNVINPRSHVERKNEYMKTLVKRGATIGANATIVCGVTLGAYSFIGAGAVVTRDVADHSVVYGNPARHRGWVCQCGLMLDVLGESNNDSEDKCSCGLVYVRDGAGLRLNSSLDQRKEK